MTIKYFKSNNLWDEDILGVIEDALKISPFLDEEQRNTIITLLYSNFYESYDKANRLQLPFAYTAPTIEKQIK